MNENNEAGYKKDEGKAPLDLVPWVVLEEVAQVMGFGAKKYGVENWRKGMRWGRVAAAALRHLFAWLAGKDLDEETGKSHLSHAVCCLLFLMTYQKFNLGEDDRKRWYDLDNTKT